MTTGRIAARNRHLLSISIAILVFSSAADSAVTLDGTLGTSGPLAGPDYAIPESVGQTRGANLFHSFGQFSLGSGESATFGGSAGIGNIIARVTGGAISSIDGRISSTITGANLYLINPSGIVFGQNARLDLSGSFHASTADYIGLADGGRFDAHTPANSVLTTAAPAAFGFLGNQPPAPISMQAAGLAVPTGATLSLIGGDIAIDGPGSFGVRNVLTAASGRINIVSVASAGEVIEEANGINVDSFTALGRVSTGHAAFISTAGYPGGRIFIRAGELTLDYTSMSTSTYGAVSHPGTGYDIQVSGAMRMRHSELASTGFAAGNAGSIRIQAGTLEMTGLLADPDNPIGIYTNIGSRARSTGRGGDVDITTGGLLMEGDVSINNHSLAAGQAGDIRIQASDVQLNGMQGDAFISNSAFSTGHAGNITIDAGRVSVLGGRIDPVAFTGIATQVKSSAATAANGGTIRINSGSLELLNGGQISSRINIGSGRGGDINITSSSVLVSGVKSNGVASAIVSATSGFTTTGNSGAVNISADQLTLDNSGHIDTGSASLGDAGVIALTVRDLTVRNGAYITSSSLGGPGADGGNIRITGDTISLSGGSPLGTYTGILAIAGAYAGNAGNIDISSQALDITNGAQISSRTNGAGTGGTITVSAARVTVAGRDTVNQVSSRIDASTEIYPGYAAQNTGRGGNVVVHANDVQVSDDGTISVRSTGSGDAGNIAIVAGNLELRHGSVTGSATGGGRAGDIAITANQLLLSDDSSITTSSQQSDGGNITVLAQSLVYLNSSTITTSVQGGAGNSGNIFIDPDFVVLNHSAIAADAFGGNGGNVTIVAANFLASPDSSVTASSAFGLQGNVLISSPTRDLSVDLEKLPETVVDASTLFKSRCTAVGSRFSSFTVAGPSVAAAGHGLLLSSYAGLGAADASTPMTGGSARPAALLAATVPLASRILGCSL